MSGPIHAIHIRRGNNIGDRMSSPALYFRFREEVKLLDVGNYLRQPPKVRPSLVIAGGGAWKKNLARLRRLPYLRDVPKVAWGVGVTSRKLGPMPRGSHTKRARGWTLYGHRDVGLAGRFVPCPSCMHTAFEKPYAIEHEAVYFGHHLLAPMNWAKRIGPHMTNATLDMDKVIAFLASGEVVVTSSYHGAYWARLLGRHVALIPRGSKFWHLPKGPPREKPFLPGILNEHKEINRRFFAEVRGLLETPE